MERATDALGHGHIHHVEFHVVGVTARLNLRDAARLADPRLCLLCVWLRDHVAGPAGGDAAVLCRAQQVREDLVWGAGRVVVGRYHHHTCRAPTQA